MNFKKTMLAFGLMAAVASEAAISYTLSTDATDGAKKLYNFLATNYGKRTVSGVMTGDLDSYTIGGDISNLVDVKAVKDISGKEPALVGVDFLFATGLKSDDSWYQEYTNKTIDIAKALWNKGGIPAFTWHWKDPAGGVESYKPDEITFKFANAYTLSADGKTLTWNESSTEYTQLIRDIDVIAGYFLQLQEAGVAAIWRPLHEASGNISTGGTAWFWWGMNGAVPCVALYNLIYDEFAKKGVKNLVWDWNPQMANDKDWEPKYYDVISLDLYAATDYTTKFVNGYKTLTETFGSDKIFAISENGPIPDMSAMQANNTVFSWWMPWYESPSWSGYFVSQTAPAVWEANMSDPCTISLDEMTSWDDYNISTNPVADCKVTYSLDTLDKTIPVEEPELGDGWMKVVISDPGLNADGALIHYQPATQQTGVTSVSLDIKSTTASGVWIGLAIVTDGDADPTWQWEMSETNSCWLGDTSTTTCTFDLTKYVGDDSLEHAMDADRIFKYSIMICTEGYIGTLYFGNFKTNVGTVSDFSTSKLIFTADETKNVGIASISVNGSTDAIKSAPSAKSAGLKVQGNSLMLSTASAGQVSVDIFGLNGKRVATLFRGALATGTYAFDMSEMPKGHYIVRVKGTGFTATQPVRIK